MITKRIGFRSLPDRNHLRTDLPVLMLYNVDPQWPLEDIHERVELADVLAKAMRDLGHPMVSACLDTDDLPGLLQRFDPSELIVFNWCEEVPSVPHSCARVARVLEEYGFVFTGADAEALALSQNKQRVKRCLQRHHIPTPTWQVYTSTQDITWSRFPAIVKPAFEHCSFGITREAVVQSITELIHRVAYVIGELKQPALVEDFIDGREFHVGVIGNDGLQVLMPAEIDYSAFSDIHDRLCTYESNFDKHSLAYQLTQPHLPADLSRAELSRLKEVASAAYRVTNCRDYARMDIRLRDGIFYVLDVNHNADIGPDTSLILAAEMVDCSYGQFGSLLVNLAAQRDGRFAFR